MRIRSREIDPGVTHLDAPLGNGAIVSYSVHLVCDEDNVLLVNVVLKNAENIRESCGVCPILQFSAVDDFQKVNIAIVAIRVLCESVFTEECESADGDKSDGDAETGFLVEFVLVEVSHDFVLHNCKSVLLPFAGIKTDGSSRALGGHQDLNSAAGMLKMEIVSGRRTLPHYDDKGTTIFCQVVTSIQKFLKIFRSSGMAAVCLLDASFLIAFQ